MVVSFLDSVTDGFYNTRNICIQLLFSSSWVKIVVFFYINIKSFMPAEKQIEKRQNRQYICVSAELTYVSECVCITHCILLRYLKCRPAINILQFLLNPKLAWQCVFFTCLI